MRKKMVMLGCLVLAYSTSFAQGTENALRGFFQLIAAEGIVVLLGLFLLLAHFTWNIDKKKTARALLIYGTFILLGLLILCILFLQDNGSGRESDDWIFTLTVFSPLIAIMVLTLSFATYALVKNRKKTRRLN